MTIAVLENNDAIVSSDTKLEYVISQPVNTVTVSADHQTVITNTVTETILLESKSSETILAGALGPQGAPGISEDEKVYSKRIDFITEDILYKAEAPVGSTEGAAVWRIRKIVAATDGDITETWASGTAEFDKSWTLRASYTYS